jgi:hypothetical protein
VSSDLVPNVHHILSFRKHCDVQLGRKKEPLRFLHLVLAIENTGFSLCLAHGSNLMKQTEHHPIFKPDVSPMVIIGWFFTMNYDE